MQVTIKEIPGPGKELMTQVQCVCRMKILAIYPYHTACLILYLEFTYNKTLIISSCSTVDHFLINADFPVYCTMRSPLSDMMSFPSRVPVLVRVSVSIATSFSHTLSSPFCFKLTYTWKGTATNLRVLEKGRTTCMAQPVGKISGCPSFPLLALMRKKSREE